MQTVTEIEVSPSPGIIRSSRNTCCSFCSGSLIFHHVTTRRILLLLKHLSPPCPHSVAPRLPTHSPPTPERWFVISAAGAQTGRFASQRGHKKALAVGDRRQSGSLRVKSGDGWSETEKVCEDLWRRGRLSKSGTEGEQVYWLVGRQQRRVRNKLSLDRADKVEESSESHACCRDKSANESVWSCCRYTGGNCKC